MTGHELQRLRRRSGLSLVAFGACLGVGGKRESVARAVRRLEGLAEQPLPPSTARMARAIANKLARIESGELEP